MNSAPVIIIGAGPAGIACATQLKRYNVQSIIFEKNVIGGLIKNANLIENYTGFPNGITGKRFVSLLKKQVNSNSLNIRFEKVESANFKDESFFVETDKDSYNSKYLVVASGTKPIIPDLYSLSLNEKVFTDIYDLGEVENKDIVIIGAGDCAFDYALNLAEENKITILNRGSRIKAIPILQDRVFANHSIQYFDNTAVESVSITKNKLNIKCTNKTFKSDYLLIAVGRTPNLDFIGRQALNNSNLFQIGDVQNGIFRQTSIAIGDGIATAMKIYRLIDQN